MRTGSLILCVSLVITGCRGRDHIPHGVLQEKQMQTVLWDMMRADQFLADYVLSRDSSLNPKTERVKLYQQVFNIHKISKEEFQRSFSFYSSHPDLLKVIMDSLSKSFTEAPTAIVKPQPGTDTIKPVKKFVPEKDSVRPFRRLKVTPLD